MSFNWIIVGDTTISDQIDLTWDFSPADFGDTTYTVILEAYTQFDCFSQTSFEIIVYPNSIAEIELDIFSDTLNCAPFTISSEVIEAVDYADNNTMYEWIFYNAFDNSIVSSGIGLQPPSYLMSNPGDSIIVALIATNSNDCGPDTSYMTFYNWKKPVVSFSIDDVCLGDTSFFINETILGDSPLQSWDWTITGGQYLDNTDLSSQDPIYEFFNCTENLGYSATLTVTDTNNCQSSETVNNIQVFCLPEVEIISDLVCDGEESSFDLIFTNGSSLNILSSDSLHLWDFGGSYSLINGNTTTTNVNILYDTCGVYDVSLVVTDDNGCLAYDTVEYIVACNSLPI